MLDWIITLALFAFTAYILWGVFTRSGREHTFGGKFVWSSEPHRETGADEGQVIIVHKILPTDEDNPATVGIELRHYTEDLGMQAISLTPEQALRLVEDIKTAADPKLSHPIL